MSGEDDIALRESVTGFLVMAFFTLAITLPIAVAGLVEAFHLVPVGPFIGTDP